MSDEVFCLNQDLQDYQDRYCPIKYIHFPQMHRHEEYTQTERQGMHAWKGQHISEVVKKWGQPDKITEQNSGGKIYTWKHIIGITTFPDGKLRGRLDTLIPIINLYTLDDGIVYHWTSDVGSRAVRPR